MADLDTSTSDTKTLLQISQEAAQDKVTVSGSGETEHSEVTLQPPTEQGASGNEDKMDEIKQEVKDSEAKSKELERVNSDGCERFVESEGIESDEEKKDKFGSLELLTDAANDANETSVLIGRDKDDADGRCDLIGQEEEEVVSMTMEQTVEDRAEDLTRRLALLINLCF